MTQRTPLSQTTDEREYTREEMREACRNNYAVGFRDALALAAGVVRNWSLPTIQTPSMWLIDKAGIEADILRIETPPAYGKSA